MTHILEPGKLLNENSELIESGFSTSLVKEYSRNDIKTKKLRIKEWDYYYIGNKYHGIALTVADNSYMGLISVSFLDFENKKDITKSIIKLFTKGKFSLPSTSKEGDIYFKNKRCEISFVHKNNKRHLNVHFHKFNKEEDLRADLYLEETNPDTMVIATPFKNKKHFYYNQKVNLLRSNGYVKIGQNIYDFNDNTFGVLDWGRGIWPYKNNWYWSSLSSTYKNKRIGFNFGYGFGNNKNATENIFYYDDKSYKFDEIKIDIPISKNGRDDFLKPWKFRNDDKSIDITFNPVLNRHANMNLLFLKSKQNQVFGTFSGYVLLDDKRIYFEDVFGFAEKVENRW